MAPDFTIITCTRNSAATLPQTLQSIQQQRGVSVEHVFVDGNSTDGTLELLRAQPGAVTILEGVQGGISCAMNAGIAVARGAIVAHLHSDDYYLHDDVLQFVWDRMQASSCDWLFGRIKFDVEGRLQSENFRAPRYNRSALLHGNFVPHPATFLRREVFQRFGMFREDYRYAMDYELWLRIAGNTRVCQIDDALAAFRVHGGSASTANRGAAMAEDLRARLFYTPWWGWPEAGLRFLVRRHRVLTAARQ